jgi:hypothetical protein
MEWDKQEIRQQSLYFLSTAITQKDWFYDERLRKIITDKSQSSAITRQLISLWRDLCLLATDNSSQQIINHDQREQLLP